jgi:transposase
MKRTPGNTPEKRERYWIKVIEQARRYPEGVTAFCESKNISKPNYYFWFKRLRPLHPDWNDLSKDPSHRASTKQPKQGSELPQTEVTEKAHRRTFTKKYKTQVLEETDNAAPGRVAAILRREGLYTSHLQKWRRDREMKQESKRGPRPNPDAARIKMLEAQLARAEKKLAQANSLIELQKKVAEILKTSLEDSTDED